MSNKWRRSVVDTEFVPVDQAEAEVVTADVALAPDKEIICGVVLKRCPVISYNPWSKVLVYERDGVLIQTNSLPYHGEGYVEVE